MNSLGKLLLNIAGEEAIELSNSFGLSEDKQFDYEELVKKFQEYAVPQKNETYLRFLFNRTRQSEGESFDHFLAEARKKAKDCGFGDMEDSLLRDRLVEGIADHSVRTALLRNNKLTLEEAIRDCRAAEQSKSYSKEMQQPLELKVDATSYGKKKYFVKKVNDTNSGNVKPNTSKPQTPFKCRRCNYQHDFGKCSAMGKTCMNCGKPNHFASCCRAKNHIQTHSLVTELRRQETETEEKSEEKLNGDEYAVYFETNTVTVQEVHDGPIFFEVNSVVSEYRQNLYVEDSVVNFKLDPGAPKSILPFKTFKSLKTDKKLKKINAWLKPYGKHTEPIPVLGYVYLTCRAKDQTERRGPRPPARRGAAWRRSAHDSSRQVQK
ncbi:ATP-dependent RNA helicase [Frankliniella fusca]|uniref:ATP-dependent RNA helicase n=1 Tax=Frankliniella fusca TaxID=407009 RepID=A0AAE1GQG4_9NEOP|nr:ATP-dependent RNA helicase [Frankliniella fusca]